MDSHSRWLAEAIRLATLNVANGGGPFGAVIVAEGKILATGVNRVTTSNDPTAHAEILAIREACRVLGTFQLDSAVLYASCEPCPMCLAACYWARLSAVYFAATHADAAAVGFDDALIYRELELPIEARSLKQFHLTTQEALQPFQAWQTASAKTPY